MGASAGADPAGRAGARAVHRRLLALAPGVRPRLGLAIAASCVAAGLVVVQAAALARVVAGAAFGGEDLADLTPMLWVLGGAVAGRAALGALAELLGRAAAERAMGRLRRTVAEHAFAGGVRADGARRGELVTAAVHGVDALGDYYARAVPQVALAAAVPPALVAVLIWNDPLVGGLIAITLPVVVVFMVLVGRASAAHATERRRALNVLGAHFLDVVRGLATLRAHHREAAQEPAIAAIGERYRHESLAALRVAFLSALVLELLAMVGTAIAAAVVGVQLVEGAIGFQAGLFVLLLTPEVYAPLRLAGQRYHAAEDGAEAAGALLAVLDEPTALDGGTVAATDGSPIGPPAAEPVAATLPAQAATSSRSGDPAAARADLAAPASARTAARSDLSRVPLPDPATAPLTLSGVVVRGGRGRVPALDGVDLALAPGRLTALVGDSGAGKSTLLRLLARLADPGAGSVRCGAVDLRALAPERWWTRVTWLPQRPVLPAGTLAEILGLDGRDRGADRVALERAGALEIVADLADGLATRVGEGGRGLSAGQVQRLALAGALRSQEPLLLLDEPTAHLDPDAAAAAAAGIRAAAAGRTVIVATHDPALMACADETIELRAGRVLRRDRAAELEVAA